MADVRTLKLNLLADVDQFGRQIKRAESNVNGFQGTVNKASKAASAAFAALAASAAYAAVTIGKEAVKAAIADQAAQAKLAKALQNTTKANGQQIASVEKWITKQQLALGISDNALRPAYANLARATGDLTKSQELATLAMDISAATGKDLESVSLALGKAYNGNLGALTKLGIPLDENIKKTKDFNLVQGELTQTFQGSATTAADTYEGKLRRVREALSEMQEGIGTALLPQVGKFVDFANNSLIPTLQRISDGMTGVPGDTKDAAYSFGLSIRDLTGSFSDLFSVFNGAKGGSLFNTILMMTEANIIRFTKVIGSLAKGLDVIKGALGISTGGTSNAATAESRDAARSAGRTAGTSSAVATSLEKVSTSASKATKNVKKLTAAQKALAAAQEAAKKLAEEVAESFKNYATNVVDSITNTVNFSDAFKNKGEGSFMSALRAQAAQAREFGGRIAKLVSLGLSRGALSQILSAGPIVGSQIADELIQGGEGAVGETNALVGGIADFASQVAQFSTTGVSGQGAASLGAGAINITINGAIDPEGVRRSLENLFQQSGARIGDVNFAGANL